MRDAIVANGGKAEFINPEIPVDLVIDHCPSGFIRM